jgi:hypothetical protein
MLMGTRPRLASCSARGRETALRHLTAKNSCLWDNQPFGEGSIL